MAHRIEIKGPFSYVLLGLVTVFSAGNWLAPGLVAGLTGKVNAIGACCAAVIERYHRNLSGHWITAEKGIYATDVFPVLGGENVIVDFDVDQIEGSVGFQLVRYSWGFRPEYVWSERVRRDQTGSLRIPVRETGLYGAEAQLLQLRR